MTLDQAIEHCNEVAKEQERKAQSIGKQLIGSAIAKYQNECVECAASHRQLAEWLKELKEAKRLLSLALDDIAWLAEHSIDELGVCSLQRDSCEGCPLNCGDDVLCGWRYQVDVLKILQES